MALQEFGTDEIPHRPVFQITAFGNPPQKNARVKSAIRNWSKALLNKDNPGTAAVVGTGTLFNTELVIGESVQIREEEFTVLSITDNTNFTLSGNHVVGAGPGIGGDLNAIVFVEENLLDIKNFGGTSRLKVNRLGELKHTGDRFETTANNTIHLPVLSGTTAETLGRVDVYQKTSTSDTVTAGQFTAGDTSGPQVIIDGSAVFAASDFILIEGDDENDGLFEVASNSGNVLELRGVGGTTKVEDFTRDQVVTKIGTVTITKVKISVRRTSLTGTIEHGEGSTTPIGFVELANIEDLKILNQDTLGSDPGSINYDIVKGIMNIQNLFSGSSLQVGHENIVFVINNTGSTITDGKVVNIDGYDSASDAMEIIMAKADTVENTEVLGMATTEMLDGEVGLVTIFGRVNDLDTTSFTEGEIVYLSETVLGGV